MSDYETHTGKVKKVPILENESFEDACKRIWVENGMILEDYDTGQLFNQFYEKYLQVEENIWEIFEDLKFEEEDFFCQLHDNGDGTFSYHTRFYNLGTCAGDMIGEELLNIIDKQLNKNG